MNIYDSLVRWAVPVFVMISGMLHLKSRNNDDFSVERQKIYKKIIRIICAIAFWTIIYNTFFPIMKCLFKDGNLIEIAIAFRHALHNTIFGPGWYHLWYLYLIIGLYLITPILNRFIANAQRKHIEYALILFFVFGTCIQLYNTINIMFDNIVSWFPTKDIYFPFPEITGYTGYYIAGYYFSQYDLQNKNRTKLYLGAVISILFTILGSSMWSIYKNEPHGDLYGNILPNTMIISIALFIFIKNVSYRSVFEKYKNKIIFISELTFGIYLVHDLLLQIMSRLGLNSLSFNPLISIPIIAFIVFIIGSIIIIFIKRIPILKKYVI
jgi:surface polysaccharide O-acyltransferase-like enzyme